MRSDRLLAAGCALLAAAATAAPARAGGLLLAPSSVSGTVTGPGTTLRPIVVRNGTDVTLDLDARALVARQELSGLPVYATGPAARRAGRAFLRVSPARFRLRPGEVQQVTATVRAARPQTGRGAYGVVLFEAVPPRTARSGAARNAVSARLRLTANVLLTYPSARHPAVVRIPATGLRAEQGPGRSVRFLVRTHGAGTIHGRPLATLRVRDAAGRVVARAVFPRGNVLPGADREFPAVVDRVLPAGRYSARAKVRAGGRTTTATLRFRLVAPGRLPTADLRIAALPVPRPAAGRSFRAALGLRNRGTATAPVRGTWELRSAGGQRRLGGGPLPSGALPAGGTRALGLQLPAVRAGQWRLVVALQARGRELDRREVVFTAGDRPGAWTRFQDWAAGHVPLLLGLFGGTLALVLGAAAAYTARLRRRLRGSP